MMTALLVLVCAMMVAGAVFAVHVKSLLSAVITVGVVSLLSSVVYIVLAAPDVAMTEAAIGAGLSTVIFLYALKRVREGGKGDD